MKFHIESGGFSLHVYKSLKAVKLTEGTNLAIKKAKMVHSGHLKCLSSILETGSFIVSAFVLKVI